MQCFFGQDMTMCAVGTIADDDDNPGEDERTDQAGMPNDSHEIPAEAVKAELKRHILFSSDCDR